jgi:amino acid adenylation domain-containing protein
VSGAPLSDAPLSDAQQRQWIAGLPDDAVLAWRVLGRLDTAALRAALTALVHRHPALRTRFIGDDVVPRQVVTDDAAYELSLAIGGPPDAVDAVRQPAFDFTCGPLVRAVVTRQGDDTLLTVVVPRIVCDSHSVGLLSADLAALYREAAAGAAHLPPPAPTAPVRAGRRPSSTDQRAFWQAWSADLPAYAELPADLPRPPVHTRRTGTVFVDVPRRPVHRLCAECPAGTTAFTVFAAGLAALLARYSRSRDVVFATGTPGARPPGAEHLVGCPADLLPLRIDASDAPSLRALAARVREAARAAVEHALPFQRLVDELAPDRRPNRHPIAQVGLDLWSAPASGRQAPGLQPMLAAPSGSAFDLAVAVADIGDDDSYRVAVSYNLDLFTRAAGERVAGHFRRLLADGLDHPDRPLSRLALLGQAEWRQEIVGANSTVATPAATIVDLFERQVAAAPQATAVRQPPYRRSFTELDADANRLANLLVDHGVGPDDRVAVLLSRGPALVVALLAVLKAGGGYVPIDPAHPAQRMAFILRDSGARLLLTDRALSERLPGDVERLHVDALPLVPDGDGSPRPAATITPDNLAYVIYTSGSTGVPKGVAVTHRCVTRLVCGLDQVPVGPGDTLLMLAPAAFDASTFEMWNALCNGAGLAIYSPGPVGPRELGAELLRLGVTVLWLTAQLANLVADVYPQALAPVRTLVVGGEVLSVPHLRALMAANPALRVVNGYGPTETTTFATTHPVRPEELDDAAGPPIGRPIGDTRCYIVDDSCSPVPAGILGELVIGGAGVARGYLGRPALTAERFVPDPFGAPGGRLYRTGDLARRRSDGTIEFAGRIDDQIKLRGFRIEPGEVRSVLVEHPAVRDAFVTVRGSGLAAELVAYVVRETGDVTDDRQLWAYLRDRLPEPLVPGRFVTLDRLPLTSNGKVDRRALPGPVSASARR